MFKIYRKFPSYKLLKLCNHRVSFSEKIIPPFKILDHLSELQIDITPTHLHFGVSTKPISSISWQSVYKIIMRTMPSAAGIEPIIDIFDQYCAIRFDNGQEKEYPLSVPLEFKSFEYLTIMDIVLKMKGAKPWAFNCGLNHQRQFFQVYFNEEKAKNKYATDENRKKELEKREYYLKQIYHM